MKPMKMIRRLLVGANKAEEAFVVFIFGVMLIASFAQVLNRNIFQLPIGWYEELARYAQIYLALLATELGLRDGSQMSLTALTDVLPPRGKTAMALIAKAIVVVFSLVLCVKSIELFHNQIISGQRSPGLNIPMSIPYFALPLSFSIASFVQTVMLIHMIMGFFLKKSDEGANA